MMCEKCKKYESIRNDMCEVCNEKEFDFIVSEIMSSSGEAGEMLNNFWQLQDEFEDMKKQRDEWKKRAELAEQRVQDMAAVHFDSLPND